MGSASVSAALFARDLVRVGTFYSNALAMKQIHRDADHWILDCNGFRLIVHLIPKQSADEIKIDQPPERRVWGSIRLDYSVGSIKESRALAKSLGGGIDNAPPAWSDQNASFFLGYDPEGNQFGINQLACMGDSL
jgi:hypothetical protein